MSQTSLDVIENFFGEALLEEHVAALQTAPEEQILELFSRLNDGWVAWFDERFDKGLTPDQHYFLGEGRDSTTILPLEKYKQLSLYFPVIAVPDPLEVVIDKHLLLAKTLGLVTLDSLRHDLTLGATRLMQIAPLVRAQAVALVPSAQIAATEGVQSIARNRCSVHDSSGLDPEVEVLAVAEGICSMAAYWPLASTDWLWGRLRSGGDLLAQELAQCNVAVAQAVAEFDVPSARRLNIRDILALRANEEAFAEFRQAFGLAMRESLDQSRLHGSSLGEQYFRDRLRPHQERCNALAKTSGAFDGALIPAGAAFAMGGLSWLLIGDNPLATPEKEMTLLIAATATPATWFVADRVRRLVSGKHPGSAVYAALVDLGCA